MTFLDSDRCELVVAVEGEEKGEGRKVTSEVDGDGEGEEESTAEQ